MHQNDSCCVYIAMHDKLTEIFQEIKYESSIGLNEKIWNTIKINEKRNSQVKLWIFSSLGFISFVGLIPTFKLLLNDLTQSGFYEYLSLVFSDTNTLLLYSKELFFSLVESLPTTSIIFTLTLLFTIFLSTKYVIKQIINNNSMGENYRII